MTDYSQPDFYHFNEDSIRLVRFAVERATLSPKKIADFGAGCGIIGIELARRLKPLSVNFVEAQQEFLPHLEENLRLFMPSETSSNIFHGSFSQCPWDGFNFDLILCNPPFYLPGHGQLAKDPRKQVCRSFELDSWDILLDLTKRNLAQKGEAHFVLPSSDKLLGMIQERVHAMGLIVEMFPDGKISYLSVRLNKN